MQNEDLNSFIHSFRIISMPKIRPLYIRNTFNFDPDFSKDSRFVMITTIKSVCICYVKNLKVLFKLNYLYGLINWMGKTTVLISTF